jgi:hypothetical protein
MTMEMTKNTPNAVVLPANPWSRLATELDKYIGAPILKFTKDGQFALSDTDSIQDGTRCVARVDLVQTGWVKWLDGLIEKKVIGAVADGFTPPARDTLDDTDELCWDRDASGKLRDPWQFQMVLPVTRLDTDETLNFTTGSKGGLNAISKLIRTYGTRIGRGQGGLPVVELRADFYKHREYGKIYFPKFLITNWTEGDGAPMSVEQDLNDSVPY